MGIYAAVTLAHGSGFLAVLVAGVVIGDQRAPFKAEIVRFHSALANLAEIIAFVMLGLTIQIAGPHGVADGNAWLIGLGLAGLLALVIRPLVLALLLWQARLTRGNADSSPGPGSKARCRSCWAPSSCTPRCPTPAAPMRSSSSSWRSR